MGAGLRNSLGPMSLDRPERGGLRSHSFGREWMEPLEVLIGRVMWSKGSLCLHGYCVDCRETTEMGGRQGSITQVQVGEMVVGSEKLCWK